MGVLGKISASALMGLKDGGAVLQYRRVALVAAAFSFGIAFSSSEHVLSAQEADKPAIAPLPRTINGVTSMTSAGEKDALAQGPRCLCW